MLNTRPLKYSETILCFLARTPTGRISQFKLVQYYNMILYISTIINYIRFGHSSWSLPWLQEIRRVLSNADVKKVWSKDVLDETAKKVWHSSRCEECLISTTIAQC